MPIRASGSFRRYLTPGVRPRPDDERFYERLRENRFKAIDERAVAQPSIGWIEATSFASSDFRPETVFFGPVARLRLRIDQKKLPPNAVKLRVAEALRGMKGRVARSVKDEMRQEVEKELLGRAVPGTKLIDVYWRPQEHSLLLAATSAAAHELFSALFKKTFGAAPEPASPAALAERLVGKELGLDRLRRLQPFSIAEA